MHSIAQASTVTPSEPSATVRDVLVFTPEDRAALGGLANLIEAAANESATPEATAVRVAEHLAALAPQAIAKVRGRRAAEPGHYPWCKPGACKTHEGTLNDPALTWTEHESNDYRTLIEGLDASGSLRLVARLEHDESIAAAPIVHLCEETGYGAWLDAAALDKAIVRLDGLVSLLRVMRAQMDIPAADDPEMRARVEDAVDRIMSQIRPGSRPATAQPEVSA